MKNLSSKLLAVNEITNEVFGGELENTYVITIWEREIQFSSHYNRRVASKAMTMDGAKVKLDDSGFTTISFKYFELNIEIILS